MQKNPYTKLIFRTVIALMLLMWVIAFISEGFTFKTKVAWSCPKDAIRGFCENPFYEKCEMIYTKIACIEYDNLPPEYQYITKTEYLPAGFSFGEKESFISKNYLWFSIILIVLAFFVNNYYNKKFNEVKKMEDDFKPVEKVLTLKKDKKVVTFTPVSVNEVVLPYPRVLYCMKCRVKTEQTSLNDARRYDTSRGAKYIALFECNTCKTKTSQVVKKRV